MSIVWTILIGFVAMIDAAAETLDPRANDDM